MTQHFRISKTLVKPHRVMATLAMAGGLWLTLHPVAVRAADTDAKAQSVAERKACEDGTSGQDKATCLRELGAVKADPGKATGGPQDAASLKRNATQRCNSLPAADQADCVARINGGADTSGSVKSGGVFRERREIVPAPATPSSPTAPAPIPSNAPAPPAVM